VILDNNKLDKANTSNEAEDTSSDIKIGYIEQDLSLYNTFITLKFFSGSTKSINISDQ
jgi:hypothetical protein